MKDSLLTILRDRNTDLPEFRRAADQLAEIMAIEAAAVLPEEKISVETPLGHVEGRRIPRRVVVVPILRAGLVLLPPFFRLFPEAAVGVFGIRRDEKTALPILYYENIPRLDAQDNLFLLDPMIATGGSALAALNRLCERGVRPEKITLVGILGCVTGIQAVKTRYPYLRVLVVAEDPKLDAHKFIVPGLGDFGDRYFG